MKKHLFWVTFAIVQIAGIVLPQFGNVHLNIGPIVVSTILLLPGSVVIALLKLTEPLVEFSLVIGVNGFFWWYFVGKEMSDRQVSN